MIQSNVKTVGRLSEGQRDPVALSLNQARTEGLCAAFPISPSLKVARSSDGTLHHACPRHSIGAVSYAHRRDGAPPPVHGRVSLPVIHLSLARIFCSQTMACTQPLTASTTQHLSLQILARRRPCRAIGRSLSSEICRCLPRPCSTRQRPSDVSTSATSGAVMTPLVCRMPLAR